MIVAGIDVGSRVLGAAWGDNPHALSFETWKLQADGLARYSEIARLTYRFCKDHGIEALYFEAVYVGKVNAAIPLARASAGVIVGAVQAGLHPIELRTKEIDSTVFGANLGRRDARKAFILRWASELHGTTGQDESDACSIAACGLYRVDQRHWGPLSGV